jgi:hypothetical protein
VGYCQRAGRTPQEENAQRDFLENTNAVHFDVRNGGTGPAIIEWIRVKWNGQPTNGPGDLLERCCRKGPQHTVPVWRNIASGMTIPAGQPETIFQIRAADADAEMYRLLDTEARFKVEAESCYCSVLDQCWITDFKLRPQIVKACEPISDNQRW